MDATTTRRLRPSIRHLVRLVALIAVAATAVACGGSSDDADAGGPTKGDSSDTRTITHALGTVEVPVEPQRVVSVGFEEQQMILHFGVVPLLQRDYTDGTQPFGTWPWDLPHLEGAEPETFVDDIPFERIGELKPDLILAVNGGLEADQYERLTEIAPTVAQPVGYGPWDAPGPEQFLAVGAALGREAEAQEMLDDTYAMLEAVKESHPEWAELYAGSLTVWEPVVNIDTTDHVRGQVLEALGFKPIPEDMFPLVEGTPTVSFEEVDLLDALDLLVWMDWEETPDTIRSVPLRDTLDGHAEGREVHVGPEYAAAFRILPHAIEYLIDWLVPELEAAADGDPSTPVPSAVAAGLAPGS